MGAYNCEDYLDDAIGSVVAQTYPDWELIVVDDGSTDRTFAVAKEWARRDGRIQAFTQTNSGRPGPPRNRGVQMAKGEFITFLDGDDLIHPDRLRTVSDLFDTNPDVGVVYHDYVRFVDEDSPFSNPPYLRTHGYLAELAGFFEESPKIPGVYTSGPLLYAFFATTGTGVRVNNMAISRSARRSGGDPLFREDLIAAEDTDLWLRLAEDVRFLYSDTPLAAYRLTPGSIMTASQPRILAESYAEVKGSALRAVVRGHRREELRFLRPRVAAQWLGIGWRCREAGLRKTAAVACASGLWHARTVRTAMSAIKGLVASVCPGFLVRFYRWLRGTTHNEEA
jgi:glycosyltransferase involved in cell wall biosynthesis